MPIIELSGSSLCPVDAYRKMCLEIPSSNNDDALFLLPSKNAVTYLQLQTKLRDCIRKIGLDPKLYSTHSFRRGMSILAFQAGIHPDKIKLLGDWKSECCREYLNFDLQDKLSVCGELKAHLLEQSSVSSEVFQA